MNTKELWQATLGELEVVLSKANFTTWFRDTFILDFDQDKKQITIAVPNSFTKEWLENKYHTQISSVIKKIDPQIKDIKYKVASKPQAATDEKIESSKNRVGAAQQEGFSLNPSYTFESFVVGESNKLAHASCVAVANNPGKTYNPLFLYGGVGLGKTHLIQAVGNEALRKNPKKKVVYVSCEKFTNDFVQAISSGHINKFKKTYRCADILLVDDIQFLSNKEGTQEEFFHTFNALHQDARQIVITSDRVPKAIPGLEERLSSRFGWGMVADLLPPNLEMRLAILRSKCQERGFDINQEILEYIAKNIQSNIRELEGALTRINTLCNLDNTEPSLEIATRALENIIDSSRAQNLTVKKIMDVVVNFFQLKNEDVLSSRRNKEFVYPRQIIMYLLRHEMSLSFPKISKELKRKDHTTIMHGCNKIEKEISRNESLRQELSIIKEKIYIST